MKSKDCLDLLMFNQKKVKNGFEFINLKTKERATIENCYEIIKKDLEILEMFKKRMSIEVAYYNGDKRFGTYKYIEYNGAPLDVETKEEFNKIKEWLENDK